MSVEHRLTSQVGSTFELSYSPLSFFVHSLAASSPTSLYLLPAGRLLLFHFSRPFLYLLPAGRLLLFHFSRPFWFLQLPKLRGRLAYVFPCGSCSKPDPREASSFQDPNYPVARIKKHNWFHLEAIHNDPSNESFELLAAGNYCPFTDASLTIP
jgi:hypothetical protein